MNYSIIKCQYENDGIRQYKDGLYICVNLPCGDNKLLNLYDVDKTIIESIPLTNDYFYGNTLLIFIKGLNITGCLYKFSIDGVTYIDPYSKYILGNDIFGVASCEENLFSAYFKTKPVKDWDNDKPVKIPYNEAVLYSAHVRGLTKCDQSIKNDLYKGTFLGLEKKIKYFKEYGITSLILLPIYERIELPSNQNNLKYEDINMFSTGPKLNYWGFGDGFYYSLKKTYAFSDDVIYEFKHLVKRMHENNMECILSFDLFGKDISFVLNVLKFWVTEYHVDGFRLFVSNEIAKVITNDSFFDDTKLIFNEYFDVKERRNKKYKNIAFVSSEFIKCARKFLKSDEDMVSSFSYLTRLNSKDFAIINEISDFNTFTLNDLVSYDRKHNYDNLENNYDGTDYNYSWNCGEEGPSKKKSINQLRLNQCINGLLLMLLSQGTPLINAGDEWLNTAKGNNNPYCQDNETGWINYYKGHYNKAFNNFFKKAVKFRKEHFVLHQPFELKLTDYISCKLPDLSFHGEEAFILDSNPSSRSFALLFSGYYSKQYTKSIEDSVYIVYNMHWDDKTFSLPLDADKYAYSLVFETNTNSDFVPQAIESLDNSYTVKGRSIAIFLVKEK